MGASRIDLQVPFAEKDEAKRLGARWDSRQRTWYVPEGIGPAPFKKWLPETLAPNIRASRWDLAIASRECHRCGEPTHVYAILLPPEHETLEEGDDPAGDRWERGECSTLLSYVENVSSPVAGELYVLASRYRLDHSQTTDSFYWMNHCEHCEAKLGDFETMEEPGTFFELGAGLGERRLTLEDCYPIAEPFSGRCGGYVDVQ
jgi:Domain of unknown function (DUF5710)